MFLFRPQATQAQAERIRDNRYLCNITPTPAESHAWSEFSYRDFGQLVSENKQSNNALILYLHYLTSVKKFEQCFGKAFPLEISKQGPSYST